MRDMRAARRRRYLAGLDAMEVLYRVYVCAIFGGWGLALLAGAIADAPLKGAEVDWLSQHAPGILGLGTALAVAIGLRLGARGGPLAIEAADVQYVLLAPIDRGSVLRGPALRQLRAAGLFGAVAGLIVANFALRRLPGSALAWLAALAAFGAAVPLLVLAGALLASGRRIRPPIALLASFALVAWSISDLLLGTTTSPMTMLGDLATLPLQDGAERLLSVVALALVGIAVWSAAASIGGLSLQAARRRAALAAQLRFAAAVRDVRTVVLLRRQLASEQPRRRPWLTLHPSLVSRWPVWRRGWQSILRWPAVRVGRVVVIAVMAGLCMAGAWGGTTPLLAVAGPLLLIAALDAVEPFAQEIDHPTRRDLLPMAPDRLARRHLLAPTIVMAGVTFIALATMALLSSPRVSAPALALVLAPTATLLLASAALSASNDPYAYILAPQLGYVQAGLPVALAVIAPAVPVLLAREAERRQASPLGVTVGVEIMLSVVAAAAIWWLGRRNAARAAAGL
ncbi:MAG: hypothetical protein ACHQCF_03460 [Solirubrobacterales bacterium]